MNTTGSTPRPPGATPPGGVPGSSSGGAVGPPGGPPVLPPAPPGPAAATPRPPFWKTAGGVTTIILGGLGLAAALGSVVGYFLTFDIPEVRQLQDWKPHVVTTLYSADGQVLYQFGAEKRIVVGLDQVPKSFLDALIATEDSHFYEHMGIDLRGIARAIITDVIRLKKAQGGSTITQQLARSLFLRPEKTIRRKLQEMVLALQIEKSFTKSEILGFYCNQVYMGHGRYGIEAAAEFYFGKPSKELRLEESALLAGLVQRPEAYSPDRSPERAKSRRNHVLDRMVREGKLAREEADAPITQNVAAQMGDLASFTHPSWIKPPAVGKLRYGVVTEVSKKGAAVRLGDYTARFGA